MCVILSFSSSSESNLKLPRVDKFSRFAFVSLFSLIPQQVIKLDDGFLLAFDKDPVAIDHAKQLRREDSRFDYVHGSFADLPAALDKPRPESVTGLLLDLGVSSPQIDDPSRGFSFMQDGPLDMRMDTSSGQSAAEWIAVAREKDITQMHYR